LTESNGNGAAPAGDAGLVLFVCAHGAAKSVLAAATFDRLARAEGMAIDVQAAGVEPDDTVAPAVIPFLSEQARLELPQPQRVTEGDLARASRIVTFDLEASDLPDAVPPVERWDGLPSAGEDPEAFLEAVTPRAQALVRDLMKGPR